MSTNESSLELEYTPEARLMWEATADHFGLPYNYPNKMARSDAFLGMELDDKTAKAIVRRMIQQAQGLIDPAAFKILNDRNADSVMSAMLSFFGHDNEHFTEEEQAAHLLCLCILSVANLEKDAHAPSLFKKLIEEIKPNEKAMEILNTFEVHEAEKRDLTQDVIDHYNQEYGNGAEEVSSKEDVDQATAQ